MWWIIIQKHNQKKKFFIKINTKHAMKTSQISVHNQLYCENVHKPKVVKKQSTLESDHAV